MTRARGGKGGAEPRLRVRRREREVIRLSTEGHSQQEIARRVGVSQPAVSKIIRRADERWLSENRDRVTRYKAEHLRKLTHLFREYMRGWEASQHQRTRRRQRKTDGMTMGPGGAVAEVIVEDSHGDPRYLEGARRVLADIAQVYGAAAAADVEAQDTTPIRFELAMGDERTAPRQPLTPPDGRES